MKPDRAHVWEEGQFEGEKETATSLTLDEVQHSLWPGSSPWKTQGISIGEFLKLLNAGEEVIDLFSSCDTLVSGEAASNWYIFGYTYYIILHVGLSLSLVATYTFRMATRAILRVLFPRPPT